jgi:hypothetical protein
MLLNLITFTGRKFQSDWTRKNMITLEDDDRYIYIYAPIDRVACMPQLNMTNGHI